MALPISFDDVTYFKRTLNGDLIVTEGVIYYFPNIKVSDLSDEPGTGSVGDYLLFTSARALRSRMRKSINRSFLRKDKLWFNGDSSVTLQRRLDAHIAQLKKEKGRAEEFSSGLPLPLRFTCDDVAALSLSFMGTLTFDACFDVHDFFVNSQRKKLLREALHDGGFLRSA